MALSDDLKTAILDVWKAGAIEVFEGHIKPESEFALRIAKATAIVTLEMVNAPDDATALQKRQTLLSARRTFQREAEILGAVVRNEVWERSMATLETVAEVLIRFARGAVKGLG